MQYLFVCFLLSLQVNSEKFGKVKAAAAIGLAHLICSHGDHLKVKVFGYTLMKNF